MSKFGNRVRAVRRRISVVDPVSRWWAALPTWAKALIALAALAFAVLYPRTLSDYWQSILFFPVGIYVPIWLVTTIVLIGAGIAVSVMWLRSTLREHGIKFQFAPPADDDA